MDLAQGGLHTTQSILPAQIGLRGFKESENMRTQSWMGRERGVGSGRSRGGDVVKMTLSHFSKNSLKLKLFVFLCHEDISSPSSLVSFLILSREA